MEKNGEEDERRVMSRQSGPNKKKPHHHHHHLPVVSGNVEKEKLRREKVKRLSVVEREMGFDGGDEQLLHSTTVSSIKFKLPRKIFSDSNTSVPRKLRSAIRKRSCESASVAMPNANRPNNSLKKPKLCMNGWSDHSSGGTVSVEISKDEEEVAETLFALAGLIPHDGMHANDKDEECLDGKMTGLSKIQNNDAMPSSEDPMVLTEEPKTANPASTTNGPPRDSLKKRTVDESAPLAWSKLSEGKQMNPNLKVSVPPAHFHIPPLLRACDDRRLTHSTPFYGSTEQNLESRLNETDGEKFKFPKRESHINIGAVDLAASQDRENATSSNCGTNALTLRPSHGRGVDGLLSQSAATIFPSWPDKASSYKIVFCKDTPSAGEVPYSINGGRKMWRRCVAHVYISHLIQVLQSSERRDTHPLDTSQLRPSQCHSTGHASGNRDDLSTTVTAGLMFGSAADKNCETANDVSVLPKKCQVEDQGRSLSGNCNSKEESYNFLSLSTGAGTEVNNGGSVNRLGITMDANDHVLQLHSVAQHNTYMPCSMPQNSFPPIRYGDHAAAVSAAPPSMPPQVHIQLPSYYSNHCGPIPLCTARSTQLSHPKQQQQIWTAQLSAQLRPSPLLSSHIANWQNSTRDPHSMIPMQAHLPASRPSLETIGSKYLQIPQQPQAAILRAQSILANVQCKDSKQSTPFYT
ncbi:uncharacterized protein LOC110686361 isoform X2 [Chenopodium quinoa]|uniref:uncharacterized protein LOC110686361 isoform X2 n=1 Tax=Chenopodium quinoa TaxID=63459 RepID=UPI000B7890A3|nr:uncharacterized protein LOC110686361 isoform X2 [Chenopodium quinoa]